MTTSVRRELITKLLFCKLKMKILTALILTVSICGVALGEDRTEECIRPVPFAVNKQQLSASSSRGRFSAQSGLITDDDLSAWCAAKKDKKQWLQVDLQENKDIMALALQGLYEHSWVTTFYIQYSSDGQTWYCYGSDTGHRLFAGNDNDNTLKVYVLHLDSIFARYVRINPRSWQRDLCLRTEIYGCPYNANKTYDNRAPVYNNTCGREEPTEPPSSTATVPPTIAVEDVQGVTPISPFNLLLPSRTIVPSEFVLIGVAIHEGNEVTYRWKLGNEDLTKQVKMFWHVYNLPGIYDVEVTASNSNNTYTNSGTIVVQDRIGGLKCVDDTIAAKPMDKSLIKWVISKGTNATFTISTGDGSFEQVRQSFSGNFKVFSLLHQYERVGIYYASIIAKNDVDEKEIKCTVIMEDPIAGLTIAVPPPRIKNGSHFIFLAVGESIKMEGKITNGTSVFCSFDFGEEVLNKSIDVFKATYTYHQTGNYTVRLTCKNRVSSSHKDHPTRIVIQKDEPITNLQIEVDVTRKGERSLFTLVKTTGTAFVCDWTFGDGITFQTDISDIDAFVFHQYTEEGPYDVSVGCTNRYGVVEAKSVAWVQIPITDLTCDSLQTHVNTSDETSFNISVLSGSHATVLAEFENNQTQSVSLEEGFSDRKYLILKHSFTSNGSYEVALTASNRLSKLSTRCKPVVVVQNALRNVTLTTHRMIIKVANNVVFSLKITDFEGFLPTDASCLWHFGDSSPVYKRRLIFNIHEEDITRHRYLSTGNFITNVSCSNEVSRIALDTTITVLEPVNPIMKVCIHCEHIMNITEVSSRKHFTLGERVTFLVTSQDFDRTYHWKMSEHEDLGITEEPYISAILNRTGTFTASVVVDKVVEKISASVQFIVQENISGVTFTSSGFTWLRSSTHFEVMITKFQYGSCFTTAFSDSFNSKNNITDCAPSNVDPNNSNFALFFNRTFLYQGNYTVCLTVFNKVSDVKTCLLVEVAKPVCTIENVSIWDANDDVVGKLENHLLPIKYNKSEQFQLEGRFINACVLSDSEDVKLSWKIKRITSESMEREAVRRRRRDVETAELVWENEGSQMTVYARSLECNKYYVVFTVELTSPDVINLYGRVVRETTIKIEIVRSPIVGQIAGEKFRDADIEEKLRLDASFYDPDLPSGSGQANMKFDWYCKTQVPPNGPFFHCFDQGKSYNIPITSLTSPVFITNLDRYIANTTCIFSVKVIKESDGRTAWDEVSVFILPPGPPNMIISCPDRNCSANLQPSLDLRLEAVCAEQCISFKLYYRWELQIRNGNQWSRMHLPAELNIETTNRNLIIISHIFQNILGPGGQCRVKLEVRREGGRSEFITKTLRINEPPKDGNCLCIPPEGEISNTEFQVSCDGWKDTEEPLRYSFNYGDDAKPILTSLEMPSSSGKFRIYKQLAEEVASVSVPIRISVEDTLGMSSEIEFYLEVKNVKRTPVDLDALMNDFDLDNDNFTANITNPEEARAESQKVVNMLEQFLFSGDDDDDDDDAESPQTTAAVVDDVPTTKTITNLDEVGGIKQPTTAAIKTTVAPTKAPMSPKQIKKATIIEKSISKLNTVTKLLTSSNTADVNELLVIGDAVVRVTKNNDVLTQNARDDTIELVSTIVDAVDKPGIPFSALEKMLLVILKFAGNLLSSISEGSPVSLDDPVYRCDDEVKERGREASKQILRLLQKMCSIVLKAKSPGDADTVINTTKIAVVLQKALANSLNDSILGNDLGLFRLPKVGLFQNMNFKDDVVSLQMMSFDDSPYSDCGGEENITTSVVALQMQQSDGIKVPVSGLEREIDIRIRHPDQPFNPNKDNFVLRVNGTSSQFHTFNHSLDNVAVGLEFVSENDIVPEWTLMVAHEKRPSFQDNLASWSVYKKQRKLFLLESSLLNKKGTYHIQVQVKARASPENKNVFNASYSLKIYTLRCFFWNETMESWSSAGCKVGLETFSMEVQCLCNHLTSFAAQVSVAPNVIDFDKAFRGFVELTSSSSNAIVLSAVVSIFGIYLLLLIWARRCDVRNAMKAATVQLQDNEPSHRYKYEMLVLTGIRKGAGTTADVCCDLVGLDAHTGPRSLRDPDMLRFQRSGMDAFLLTTPYHLGELAMLKIWHNNSGSSPSWYLKQVIVRDMSNDSVFVFMCNRWLAVEFDDGQVQRRLSSARQEDLKSFNHLFYNVTERNITDDHLWFSVFVRPKLSNYTTVQRLTCCLALLLCMMLTNAMFYQLDNPESDPTVTFNVGPINLSAQEIYIGIISSLIIFPINISIAGLFKNVSPKKQKVFAKNQKRAQVYKGDFKGIVQWYRSQDLEDDDPSSEKNYSTRFGRPSVEPVDMEKDTMAWLNKSLDSCDSQSCFAGLDQNELQENESNLEVSEECSVEVQIIEKNGSASAKRMKRKLPHWFVYIGWFGLIVVTATSALFVTLYGFQFGKEKATQWLLSLCISFVQDVFISQPIKVLFVALFIALLVKRPQEPMETNNNHIDDEEEHDSGGFHDFEKSMHRRYGQHSSTKIEQPDLNELSNAREKRKREIRMSQILKEIVTYVLFLLALFVVSFGQRDPKSYLVTKLIEDTYLRGAYTGQALKEIDGVNNYWNWLEGTILPSLSSSSRDWAEGCHPVQQYTIDCNSRLVGVARVRQLRVEQGTCQVAGPMRETLSGCNGYYSMFKEDKGAYTTGWKRTNKTTNTTSSPWSYQSMGELGGLPFLGVMGTYGGGGFSFDLEVSNVTEGYLNALKHNSWIDSRTRAIFVEIAIYNAQVNLFGVATFLAEWIPTNGMIYFNNIKVARLYGYGNNFQNVILACQIFLAIFVAVFLYTEIKQVYKLRKEYFKDPWNWLEISQIVLILTGAAALLQRTFFTHKAISGLQSNPEQFISFIQATTWDELFVCLLAFLVFVANLKLLKLMRFNHRIYLFTRTLSNAAMPLLSFLVVFSVFYIAYSCLFYAVYGRVLLEYSSFFTTIETLFNTVMGGFDFETIRENNPLLGPAIFFSFNVIMVMILMNVFLTILMDSFAEVQADEHLKSKDGEVVEHMLQQFRYFFVKTGKVDHFSGIDVASETSVNLPNKVECSRSESETTIACKPSGENWLDRSPDRLQLRTVKSANGLFPLIENALDTNQIRHDNDLDESNSSDWPSFVSLSKSNIAIENHNGILPYPDESEESVTEEHASSVFPVSTHDYGECSREFSMVSQTDENYCGRESGRYSQQLEYSQSSRCSSVADSSADLNGRRKSSCGNPNVKSLLPVQSDASHLLDRDVDKLNFNANEASAVIQGENVSMDPNLSHYYQLLETAAKEQHQEGEGMLNTERFDFSDYKVCFHNFGDKPRGEMDLENCLELEPKLADLLGNFARVAISDLQEDQIFEQLFISYFTVLNEVSFEPDCAAMDSKRFKRFEKKAKWKYTRHMFTQAQ